MIKVIFGLMFFCFSLQANHHNFRVVSINEPPANFQNEKGKADGYVSEIVQAIQYELNDKTEIEFVPERRAIHIMQKNGNAVLFSISRTAVREQEYFWIGHVMNKKWHVYTLRDSELSLNDLAGLAAIENVGVVRGDVREEWLLNRGFTNLDSVTHHEQNVKRLLSKRIPAMIYERQGLAYLAQSLNVPIDDFKSIYVLNESAVYIVMSKINTSTEQALRWQQAFEKLKANGTIANIMLKWQVKLQSEKNVASQFENEVLHF